MNLEETLDYMDKTLNEKIRNFRFYLEEGDIIEAKYYGECETENNPYTGEDDEYYSYIFEIKKVIKDTTGKYKVDGLMEVCKYCVPLKIEPIK